MRETRGKEGGQEDARLHGGANCDILSAHAGLCREGPSLRERIGAHGRLPLTAPFPPRPLCPLPFSCSGTSGGKAYKVDIEFFAALDAKAEVRRASQRLV